MLEPCQPSRLHRGWTFLNRFAVLALVLSGCGPRVASSDFPTTRVKGYVHEGQSPRGGGWIEFMPTDGAKGNLRSAPIRPDGTFEADGVALGLNVVGFTNVPMQWPNARRLFDILGSPVRRTIVDPSPSLDIDLIDEMLRAQRERQGGGGS